MASVFLASNMEIEHFGCHANLFEEANVQRNDQRGGMTWQEHVFFFDSGGTVGGTNATRLHYCTVALSFVRVSRWWEAMARLANKEGPPRIGKF